MLINATKNIDDVSKITIFAIRAQMKYTELERKLKKAGCYQIGNGRHPIWFSPITNKVFQTGHHDTNEVNPKTLDKILKVAGLK